MVEPFFTARPAQPGDTCILAVPGDGADIDQLQLKQRSLQEIYGGWLTDPVHLTCQRFGYYAPQIIHQLGERLEHLTQQVKPFSVSALSVRPIYSNFRESHILKWQVEVNNDLRQFLNAVTETLSACSISPHFLPGSISSLVTCLENIDQLQPEQPAPQHDKPVPLFTVGQMLISRIEAAFQYTILERIPITGNHG